MAALCRGRHLANAPRRQRAEVAAEVLAEQLFDIKLIVNHENEQIHARPPDLAKMPQCVEE